MPFTFGMLVSIRITSGRSSLGQRDGLLTVRHSPNDLEAGLKLQGAPQNLPDCCVIVCQKNADLVQGCLSEPAAKTGVHFVLMEPSIFLIIAAAAILLGIVALEVFPREGHSARRPARVGSGHCPRENPAPMPQIIARTIADLIAKGYTDSEIREALVVGVQTARAGGYNPSRENLYTEICEELRKIADAEQDAQTRDRITRAIEIVCKVSDDSQPDLSTDEP